MIKNNKKSILSFIMALFIVISGFSNSHAAKG